MKLSKQKKREDLKRKLTRVLFVVLSTVVVVYFMPRKVNMDLSYNMGKEWQHKGLKTTFSFPVYKDQQTLDNERDSIERNFIPFYNKDTRAINEVNKKLDNAGLRGEFGVSSHYLNRIKSLLEDVYSRGVISDKDAKGHTKIYLDGGKLCAVKDMFSLSEAYAHVINDEVLIPVRHFIEHRVLNEYLSPNVMYDKEKSDEEKSKQIAKISDVSYTVSPGTNIISRGDIVTLDKYNVLRSYERELAKHDVTDDSSSQLLLWQVILVSVVFFLLMSYLVISRPKYADNIRSATLLFALVVFFTIVPSIMKDRGFLNVYMLPYCMVPVVIKLLMDTRTAFIFHIATVLMVSSVLTESYVFLVVQIVAGMFALQFLREMTQRSQIIKLSFILFVISVVLYTSYMISMYGDISSVNTATFVYFFVSGVLLLFAYPLLWGFEKVFGFVTDVTLVELSNINNPLLQRMTEVAPGTFQHSMQVGNLAADVAKRIGARVQLVRTGALYHDIGKMERPAFFTENQAGGNPHNHLSAIKSAEVIISHVTNGAALADKYHLPDLIKRFVLTHHGLGKTKYFYITYKNEHPDEDIDESLFSYPGPNPASKEEAILMMADSVEAASRSLPEYTEESISSLVEKIINGQMAEGYFLDCDITYHEISVAKAVFKERLKVIYHTRISYPELK